eukprot:374680-Pelagomonas_calceolata.AAC.2
MAHVRRTVAETVMVIGLFEMYSGSMVNEVTVMVDGSYFLLPTFIVLKTFRDCIGRDLVCMHAHHEQKESSTKVACPNARDKTWTA